MNNMQLIKESTDSRDLASAVNKRHRDVLRSIRNMEDSWCKVSGRSFARTSYSDAQGKIRECYRLDKREVLFIASKFNDELRAAIILRLDQLEEQNKRLMQAQLDKLWDKEDQKDLYL